MVNPVEVLRLDTAIWSCLIVDLRLLGCMIMDLCLMGERRSGNDLSTLVTSDGVLCGGLLLVHWTADMLHIMLDH